MIGTTRRAITSTSLYRLIYRSRDVIAQVNPDALAEAGLRRELRAIVEVARSRNGAEGLTGALLYTDGRFMQVLEGPREVVERTFDQIAIDRRHADVTVLSFTPTQRRSFPDWPLAFFGQSTLVAADSPGQGAESALEGSRVTTGSEVLRLLERVVQQEDAWIGG